MIRLITETHVTDEVTYSYTETRPVVYESKEKFIKDFPIALKDAIEAKKKSDIEWIEWRYNNPVPPYPKSVNDWFSFAGQIWFIDTPIPEVFTVNEYFKHLEEPR